MDYESALNQALDLLADGEDRKARVLLEGGIRDLKPRLSGTDADLDRYYYWGRFLTALEEYEQALLKFEKALKIDPAHEGSLWETASILLHDMDRPELAKALLAEKLLPLAPANPLYAETLKEAEFLIRVRTSPPDPGGGDGDDADDGADLSPDGSAGTDNRP
jgi:tetratricopeptide (TPR) repeat protein